jgi:hypothetical protein
MPYRKILPAALTLLLLLPAAGLRSAEQTIISAGSSWKYNDSGTNLGTAWRAPAYNDATWPAGLAQLGYGDGGESTVLSYGSNPSNRRITYYFRRAFTVADPAAIAALTLRYVRDDGCIIYLNGVEVVRSNMPAGTVTYTTRATASIGGADESAWLQAPLDPSQLVKGTNVVAVEIHQQSPSSSDVSFDLELLATEAQAGAPSVTLLAPATQSQSNVSALMFSASVSAPAGLASATLYVRGAPQTVVFSGPLQVEDAQIAAETPATPDGDGPSINIDGQTPHAHGLMKFPALVGAGSGQVPPGAAITSAMLQLTCTDSGSAMQVYRLTQNWTEDQATWNERAAGSAWASPGADGAGSNAGVPLAADCTTTGQQLVDVTRFVQEWSDGAPNYGIVFIDAGTDGVDFTSSESGNSPVLSVAYKSSQQALETKPLSGQSTTVTFSADLPIGHTYYWNVQVTDADGRQTLAPSDFELTVDASAPNLPELLSPADGSTGVATSPDLSATVSDPADGPLTVTVALRQPAAPEFTIVALPDTQHYSEAFPALFKSQTQWIVDNKESRNIVFVTHEGDIVNQPNSTSQWLIADENLSMLDGVVPYGMGPGNHDQPTTLFNQFFPYTRYQGLPWYGGHYQNLNDNNYQLFSGGGMDFVIVHLEYCPPAAALSWASSIIQSYPDRIGMMTTHAYLGLGAARSTHGCGNTQYIWDQLAVPTPNLHFMLSGHVHGESRRTDVVHGHPVFQMLADYQNLPSGGEGWLRILRFVPSESKIYVQTYSPWLNRYDTDADSEFTLDFPMGGAFAGVGTTTVASGSDASIPITDLAPDTQYEWRMTVSNSSGKSRTSPVWRFTTGSGGPINRPPVALDQSVTTPEDTARAVTLMAFDQNDDQVTFTVVDGPTRGTLSGTSPDLVYQPAANFNGTDSFTIRASDGQATSEPGTISITVQAVNDAPAASGESFILQGGQTLTVPAPGVLGNDSDVEGATLTAQLVTGPANGTLALNANGSLTYTPAAGYSGPDTFAYRASDGQAASASATVSLTIVPVDTTAPSVSITAPVPGAIVSGSVTVSAVASDSVGVAGVQFLLNGIPWGAEDTAAPYSVTWSSTGVADGQYQLSARARDAAGNQGTSAGVAIIVHNTGDTAAPAVTMTAPLAGATVSGDVTVSANASDNTGVTGVQFLLDGAPLGAEDTTAPYTVTWSSTTAADGAHQLSARARDAAGNQTTGSAVAVIVHNPLPAPAGLVASYSFNEGSGTTLIDRSGTGHTGTIAGAAWTTQGKFGGALSFDGINDWVTVNDANALDLTTGMTLEAWVRPTSLASWRTVLVKQRTGGLVYSLYASNDRSLAESDIKIDDELGTAAQTALAVNTWAHVAVTYDGSHLRLFVNGIQVSSREMSGPMTTSTGVLRIGGNSVWGEYFAGRIDEIRIYNRALTPAEILGDMVAPINP